MSTNIDIEKKIIDKFLSDVRNKFNISEEKTNKIDEILKCSEIDYAKLIQQTEE